MTSSALPLSRVWENTIRLMSQMARKLCSTRLAMYRCMDPRWDRDRSGRRSGSADGTSVLVLLASGSSFAGAGGAHEHGGPGDWIQAVGFRPSTLKVGTGLSRPLRLRAPTS